MKNLRFMFYCYKLQIKTKLILFLHLFYLLTSKNSYNCYILSIHFIKFFGKNTACTWFTYSFLLYLHVVFLLFYFIEINVAMHQLIFVLRLTCHFILCKNQNCTFAINIH